MLHKTSGIILHTQKYSDTRLIVKIFTSKFGLQTYIISGVRNKKSRIKATLFQPLSVLEMEVSHSEKGGLQRMTEIYNNHQYATIPYQIDKSSIVLFLNEILFKSIKEAHSDSDLFEFIKNSLFILDLKTENCSNFHICFMLQLSKFLGFFPQGKFINTISVFDLQNGSFVDLLPNHPYYMNTQLSGLLNSFISLSYEAMGTVKMDKNQRKQLLHELITFYKFHIDGFGEIKSLKVLEEVIA